MASQGRLFENAGPHKGFVAYLKKFHALLEFSIFERVQQKERRGRGDFSSIQKVRLGCGKLFEYTICATKDDTGVQNEDAGRSPGRSF